MSNILRRNLGVNFGNRKLMVLLFLFTGLLESLVPTVVTVQVA